MADPTPIHPVEVSSSYVLAKCNYFVDVHLWPLQTRINPELWLSNFHSHEMDHALHLLNAFLYYSKDLVEVLFKSAFQLLSSKIGCPKKPYAQSEAYWNQFIHNLMVTYITGEIPSETDSGYIFARLTRQTLGIPESQIKSPNDALEILLSDGPRPVVFVDDFVGSGEQCANTWHREMRLSNGVVTSFARYSAVSGNLFYYTPMVCTHLGREEVLKLCPGLQLCPAHFLSSRYSAISEDSIVWPQRLRSTAIDFVKSVSNRAGIPEEDWFGYKDLALTIAFEHSIPDATLPIFYYEKDGWHPLVRRT